MLKTKHILCVVADLILVNINSIWVQEMHFSHCYRVILATSVAEISLLLMQNFWR